VFKCHCPRAHLQLKLNESSIPSPLQPLGIFSVPDPNPAGSWSSLHFRLNMINEIIHLCCPASLLVITMSWRITTPFTSCSSRNLWGYCRTWVAQRDPNAPKRGQYLVQTPLAGWQGPGMTWIPVRILFCPPDSLLHSLPPVLSCNSLRSQPPEMINQLYLRQRSTDFPNTVLLGFSHTTHLDYYQ
jgi:hypothetical protein